MGNSTWVDPLQPLRVKVVNLLDPHGHESESIRKRMIHELCQAGWTVEDTQQSIFRAPWGILYTGPQGAFEVFMAHCRAEA